MRFVLHAAALLVLMLACSCVGVVGSLDADSGFPPGSDAGCCVQRPPGSFVRGFSACGGGGSHYGLDLGTPVGTPIHAGLSGTVQGVVLGKPNCWGSGSPCSAACFNTFNYLKLKSDCEDPQVPGNPLFVYYLHIDSVPAGISAGVHVDAGEVIAYSGNSGCSSGPHIHLETVSVPPGQTAHLSSCLSVDPVSRFCR